MDRRGHQRGDRAHPLHPPQERPRQCARVEAVADALTRTVKRERWIRLDANGAWDVDQAVTAIHELERAAGDVPIEYVEQPCATADELYELHRLIDVPIAADESIRRAPNPVAAARMSGAQVAVIKIAPLGGPERALRIARDTGLRVVVSSALETSVGLAAGVRTAAALPGKALACGLATASLLAADITAPLEVSGGRIHVATRSPDPELIDHSPVDGDLLSKWLARLMACAPHILDR